MRLLFIGIALLFAFQAGHSQNYKFGKVSKEELLQKAHPKFPDANAAILYREINAKVDYDKEDGYVIYTEVQERIKIYNQEGYEWANGNIKLRRSSKKSDRDQLTSLKGVTYVLNGNKIGEHKLKNDAIFEEETSKYTERTKFTMPSLKEGCVIEYKYKIKSPFLGNIDPYKFQESIPVDKVKFRFEAPEYFNYEQHQRGWIPFNIEKESANRSITEHYTSQNNTGVGATYSRAEVSKTEYKANISNLHLENIPPLTEEAYAGNISNYASTLQYDLTFVRFPSGRVEDFSSTWESVCSSIYKDNDFGQQLDKSSYFEEDLRRITAGLSNDAEKMQVIFDFVKKKMTWNSYVGIFSDTGLSKAYEAETGNTSDINLMLTAMLRKAGLKANPVLISTRSNGIPILPTQSGFNVVVAGVETPEDVILLDATNKNGQPDVLEEYLMNWRGRIIREDGSSDWVVLQSNKQASLAYMCDMSVDGNGWLSGSMKSQSNGYLAMKNRMTYLDLSEMDRSFKFNEEMENVEVTGLAFENLDNTNKPLKINYDFKTDAYSENINGDIYVTPLAFLVTDENPFNKEKRVFPIDFGNPQKYRYIVSIEIPEGYQVSSLPQGANLKMGNNNLAFKYLVSERGGKISIMGEFSVNTHFMGPEVYKDVKDFYQFLVEKEKEKIVLSKL